MGKRLALQKLNLITPEGIKALGGQIGAPGDPLEMPEWVEEQLKADPEVWENFQQFSYYYKRLKIGWIKECGKRRQEEAQRRLNYLLKMTKQGKTYGTIPISD